MFRTIMLAAISLLLTSCGSSLTPLIMPGAAYSTSNYTKISRLYEKEASFNDDIEMPPMLFRGVQVSNERYIKDPDYKPQGGNFTYRFPELQRLIAPSQAYAERQAGKEGVALLAALPKIIENEFNKHLETNEDFQQAKKKTLEATEKLEVKITSTQKLELLAKEKISSAAQLSDSYQKEEYSNAIPSTEIAAIWNKTVNNVMLKAKQRETSQNLNSYKRKIYLIHKLFINDAIEIHFDTKPKVKINIKEFTNFYKKLNNNDLMRFKKEFNTNNNKPETLVTNIENSFNRELSHREDWRPLLIASISPQNLSINNKNKEEIDELLFPNIPILFEILIRNYIQQPKKAFIVETGKEKPIFVDKMLGHLYVDIHFWESIKNNHSLRDTILQHEATHVRFNILINRDEFSYKKLIRKVNIAFTQLGHLFGTLGGMTEEEIKFEIEKKMQPLNKNKDIFKKSVCDIEKAPKTRAICKKIESLKEFIVDGEVFDKNITHKTRQSFVSFMQSRHTNFNRYKIEEFRKMGCFAPLTIKPSMKSLKNYDDIYAALIEGTPYNLSKNSDCATIQKILNRNNLP